MAAMVVAVCPEADACVYSSAALSLSRGLKWQQRGEASHLNAEVSVLNTEIYAGVQFIAQKKRTKPS